MNRLKDIIYDWVLRLASSGIRRKPSNKKLLIVRVDEIGDYLLWQKFLDEIVTTGPYKEYEVHFCGNRNWKSLFDTLATGSVTQSVWLDKIRFKKEMGYRYRFLKQIYRQGYEVVINPAFSRDKRYDDSIVKAAKAPQTLGMEANLESTRPYETGYDRHLYTHMFRHPEKPLFEFYRNRLFTGFLTGKTVAVTDTRVDLTHLPVFSIPLPEKYFVVFPGSRSRTRIWPAENFVRVSNYLSEHHGLTAVVCGAAGDAEYINAFCEQYKQPLLNLMGKTSLPEMLTVLSGAECLLSVDTGSVHLAAAVGCTVFGIFNGSQYGRFAPYPTEMAPNFYAVYPDNIEAALKDMELVKQVYEFVVPIPYAAVKPEKLIHTIYQHYQGR